MKAILKKSGKAFVILAMIGVLFFPTEMFSQGPPPWAPAKGYRAKTRHIYFPQYNFYYDIQAHHYFYLNNGIWSISVAIPAPFISINLGGATQIQLDYYGGYPYYYNADHCKRYKVVKVKAMPRKTVIIKHKEINYRKENNHGNGGFGQGNGHGGGHGKNK